MVLRLNSDGDGRENIAKCLMNRGVTGFLPPPGGAQAAAIVTSLMIWEMIRKFYQGLNKALNKCCKTDAKDTDLCQQSCGKSPDMRQKALDINS